MSNLQNKVALITGSTHGVGKAIAERYASLGANIVVNHSKDEKGALKTVTAIENLGVSAIAIQGDVSKPADITRLFAASLERFGKIDIVVANAGVELVDQPVVDFSEEQFDRLFDVNTKGTFFTLQQAAKHVADNGRIIYIGSSTTTFPMANQGLYGGSKMAGRFLIQVLAIRASVHRRRLENAIEPRSNSGGIGQH
jgi:3-oxoacyl-[acyl-carrier protein] reductase